MQSKTIINSFLKKLEGNIHQSRLATLSLSVEALLQRSHLTLTDIGRHLAGSTSVKHKIKRIDRFLRNGHLQRERIYVYQLATKVVVGKRRQIDVLVDWSPCGRHEFRMLKASIVASGRSITLYEEAHPESLEAKPRIHEQFLANLASVLPKDVDVTVITDAGFRNSWYRQVTEHGWHFISRVRNNVFYKEGFGDWQSYENLYKAANQKPRSRNNIMLSKSTPFPCSLVFYKGKEKGRKKHTSRGKKKFIKMEKVYSKSSTDPWLLATSLSTENHEKIKQVLQAYKSRMQIEQNFRDMKNVHWGQGLQLG